MLPADLFLTDLTRAKTLRISWSWKLPMEYAWFEWGKTSLTMLTGQLSLFSLHRSVWSFIPNLQALSSTVKFIPKFFTNIHTYNYCIMNYRHRYLEFVPAISSQECPHNKHHRQIGCVRWGGKTAHRHGSAPLTLLRNPTGPASLWDGPGIWGRTWSLTVGILK